MELFAVRSPIAMSSGARPSRPVAPSASAPNGGPSKRKWKNKSDDENKKEFVDLFATSHIMNHRYDAFRWLCEGMLSVLPATFYLKFTPAQLQSLICSKEEINVAEWKSECQYEMSGEKDAILSSS